MKIKFIFMKIIRIAKQINTNDEVIICEKSYLKDRVKFQNIYTRDASRLWRKHPSEKVIVNYKKIVELDKLYDDFIQSLCQF